MSKKVQLDSILVAANKEKRNDEWIIESIESLKDRLVYPKGKSLDKYEVLERRKLLFYGKIKPTSKHIWDYYKTPEQHVQDVARKIIEMSKINDNIAYKDETFYKVGTEPFNVAFKMLLNIGVIIKKGNVYRLI